MKILLLLAGTAAFALAGPAVAQRGGGHGGMGGGHAMMAHGPSMHASMSHGPNGHANAHATTHARNTHATRHARNAHATTHRRFATISASDQALAHKYGGALCPPGLLKKTPACIPPGQAKRLFRTGQLVPMNFRFITPFTDIPRALVTRYSLTNQNRFIYRNNVIYVINPRTNRVSRVFNAVL